MIIVGQPETGLPFQCEPVDSRGYLLGRSAKTRFREKHRHCNVCQRERGRFKELVHWLVGLEKSKRSHTF